MPMTPDEHAVEAVRLLAVGLLDEVRGHVISERDAIRALTHAVLALRPIRPEPPLAEGLPTGHGAVVRARIDGILRTLCRLPEDADDAFPWVCDSGMVFADGDLRDVEVLYPGVPS